ncbi:ABC transporter ATP-binding protein [Geoalkalibacter sp.]|uniref:ABC transporter ATP-binding protein n=1 Tax=Geoalkalibacter sp. TaxID=3041440 RepID=UPI00272DD816|nr:ATP-binding cassette domain-containing protein [Geoalkalibacter sp.]
MIRMQIRKRLHMATGDTDLDLDIGIGSGELVTFFGPSGAGKTTALRILAGLTEADAGVIKVDGRIWFDSARRFSLAPQQRGVGFVFQDYALFPNMTVRENLRYALSDRGELRLIDELMEIMELGSLAERRPRQLSGGQQQRVALARALARRPKLLLLDEPLSALDLALRLKLQDDLLEVHRRFGITTILVSHDLSEVFRLSHRVFVMEHGQLKRSGAPIDVFSDRRLSGKFKLLGEIVAMAREDLVQVITLLVGNSIVKVVATEEEAKTLNLGDKVLIASKAFNPLLVKVNA